MKEHTEGKKSGGSKTILAIALTGIVIVTVLITGFSLILRNMHKDDGLSKDGLSMIPSFDNLVIDEDNLLEVMAELEEKVANGYFSTDMNLIWTFPSASEPSLDAYIANSEANNWPMYFEIYLNDTEEIIYRSNIIPVGSRIKELKLQKRLSKGEYDAICRYYMIDEDGNDRGNVAVTVTLVVLK